MMIQQINSNVKNNPFSLALGIGIFVLFYILIILFKGEQYIKCVPNSGCVVKTKTNKFTEEQTITFKQNDIASIKIKEVTYRRKTGKNSHSYRTEKYYYPIIILKDNTNIKLNLIKDSSYSSTERLANEIKGNKIVNRKGQ